MSDTWRDTVADALSWAQAHVSFDTAVEDLDPGIRGVRPPDGPHSIWELVEHLRIAQADLLADLGGEPHADDEAAPARVWPDAYWPPSPAPASQEAWEATLEAVARDRAALVAIARDRTRDLSEPMPGRDGRTALRGLLLAIDHAAYHVGQIVEVRRRLGAWSRSGTDLG